ncbi:MAG: FecR domain-containing protein [Pseudomonadota bacterium]
MLSAHAAPEVGIASAVNTDARSVLGAGTPRVVTLGQTIIYNERITTNQTGLVQILLVDGTTFMIGPDCELTIDEFVFNPDTGEAKVVATVAKGAFRFIGGQTSRTEGGATVRTPVGSIGIRGATVEANISPRDATISMIFGDSLVFEAVGGDRQTIFESGFTIQVSDGGAQTSVRQTTGGDAPLGLTGEIGKNGGLQESPPTEEFITEQTGLPGSNSGSPPVNVPVPTGRPAVQSASIDQVSNSITDVDDVGQQNVQDDIAQQTPPDEDPPVVPIPVPARVLFSPETYNTDFGDVVPNPAPRGLVGSTPETDLIVDFTKSADLLTANLASGGQISVLDLTGAEGDAGLESFDVSGASPLGAISGTGYAGRGDFAFYFLGVNGDPIEPYYILTGTSTDPAVLNPQSEDVRAYSLTPDPIANLDVPFFRNNRYGALENTSQTDYLIVERDSITSRAFLTWVDISGTGSDQKSAILVTAGGTSTNETDPFQRLWSNRRGSYRGGANQPQFNMRGSPVSSLEGADGGHFFGPNAENAVVGVGLEPQVDTFIDVSTDFCFFFDCETVDPATDDRRYGTRHVMDLQSETPKSSLSITSRVHSGFMVGMAEPETEGFTNPFLVAATGNAPNFLMTINAPSAEMAAVGEVQDINNTNPVVSAFIIPFGTIGEDFGASAFVDDNTFGANQNNNRENSRVIQDNQADLAADVFNPGSYIVSGRAAPLDGYQHCTQCDFADWGWWGTRLTSSESGDADNDRRADAVHMGTWVAGDITNPADLPSGPSNASYSGTAIANVATEGGAQYIASGDFSLDIGLSTRSGSLSINNLDGANYSADVTDASTATQALFASDSLVGSNGLNGTVSGAFVNDGANIAAGAIGQFEAAGSGNQVVGTFMGNR